MSEINRVKCDRCGSLADTKEMTYTHSFNRYYVKPDGWGSLSSVGRNPIDLCPTCVREIDVNGRMVAK